MINDKFKRLTVRQHLRTALVMVLLSLTSGLETIIVTYMFPHIYPCILVQDQRFLLYQNAEKLTKNHVNNKIRKIAEKVLHVNIQEA